MIGVVILNYNSFQDTITLTKALQKQTVADLLHIIIVDNASPNGSYKELKPLEQTLPNVKVLQTGENLGYAKGNNYGLKHLEEYVNPEYVAILNNDVKLPDNCFERLITQYNELDRPAMIAPMMVTPDGKRYSPYKINTFFDDCINLFYLFKVFPNRNKLKEIDNTGKRAMAVDMIPGSFMFCLFRTFQDMGYFYPHTFLYVEERFICMKARNLKRFNYILLDETYIHAHNSPTINSAYDQIAKYRFLYDGWLEFTRVFRKYGRLKAAILKPLTSYSLWEMALANKWRRRKFERKR